MSTTQDKVVVLIGGDQVDLTDFPPLTQGDKKALRKEPYDLNLKKLQEFDEEQESKLVLFLLKKVRAKTTMEEVDALPAALVQDIGSHCIKKSYEIDSPFSTRSTSSPVSTGGQSAK